MGMQDKTTQGEYYSMGEQVYLIRKSKHRICLKRILANPQCMNFGSDCHIFYLTQKKYELGT